MNKGNFFLIAIFAFLSFTSYAQLTQYTEKDIYDAHQITFYGYDYSNFKLVDAARADQDIKKFTFVWLDFLIEHVTKRKLAKWLKKERVIFDFDHTINKGKELKSIDLLSNTDHKISKDKLHSVINKYETKADIGIGLVYVLECFNKEKKTVSGYFTFFNIETKDIIQSYYINSRDGNQYNRVNDWGIAQYVAFKKRFKKLYRKKLRDYK